MRKWAQKGPWATRAQGRASDRASGAPATFQDCLHWKTTVPFSALSLPPKDSWHLPGGTAPCRQSHRDRLYGLRKGRWPWLLSRRSPWGSQPPPPGSEHPRGSTPTLTHRGRQTTHVRHGDAHSPSGGMRGQPRAQHADRLGDCY